MNKKEFKEKWNKSPESWSKKKWERHLNDVDNLINSQWISVEDELPNDSNPVLVYVPSGDTILETRLLGVYFDDTNDWTVYDFDGSQHNCGVTHWQPLPQPPKDQ